MFFNILFLKRKTTTFINIKIFFSTNRFYEEFSKEFQNVVLKNDEFLAGNQLGELDNIELKVLFVLKIMFGSFFKKIEFIVLIFSIFF